MLEHIQEIISKLNSLGITASSLEEEVEGDEEEWESDDGSIDNDGDVDMKWRLTSSDAFSLFFSPKSNIENII